MRNPLFIALVFIGMTSAVLAGEPATRPVVLVELFTSEGCSSCPPADALLAKLAKPDAIDGVEIVPLALHVDYWNDLGWKDPYSSSDFTQRQRDYANTLHTNQVYTPQMIVDGSAEFVGSDAKTARDEILAAAKHAKGSIDLHATQSDQVLHCTVAVKDLPIDRATESDVKLAITEDDLESDVARGENAGRKLTHVAVVRSLQSIGAISKNENTFTGTVDVKLDPKWRHDKLKVIVFVQQSRLGPVTAVKSVPVNP